VSWIRRFILFHGKTPCPGDCLGMAMGVPGGSGLLRPPGWPSLPPPCSREHDPGGGPRRRPAGPNPEAGDLPHAAAFVRDPPTGGRPRHPHRPGVAGAQRRSHNDDLRPRPKPWRPADPKPGRPPRQPGIITTAGRRTPIPTPPARHLNPARYLTCLHRDPYSQARYHDAGRDYREPEKYKLGV
jgi:hypothetical protein